VSVDTKPPACLDGAPRVLISDFGGVLTTPLERGFRAYERESGLPLAELGGAIERVAQAIGENPVHRWERGELAEHEFARLIERELPERFSFHRFREVYFAHLEANTSMVKLVSALRGDGVRTALLTNNVREWEPRWRAVVPGLEDLFEVIVDSSRVGARKPERKIYELTLAALGVEPHEAVFVDDVEINCRAAAELGMATVHFRSTEQAVAELEALFGLAGARREPLAEAAPES
jgi:putative hydrolase of the HAD superfamily